MTASRLRGARQRLLLFVTLAAFVLAACTAPTFGPVTPAAPPPSTPIAPSQIESGLTVTGSIVDGSGVMSQRPMTVRYVVDETPGGFAIGSVVANSAGRYRIPNVPHGARVRARAESTDPAQRCPAQAIVTADMTLDIEVLSPTASIVNRTQYSPTLSGQITEVVDGVRRPIARVAVHYFFGGDRKVTDASTLTDENGQYVFCRVPAGPAGVSVGRCGLQFGAWVAGNSVKDMDFESPVEPTPCPAPW